MILEGFLLVADNVVLCEAGLGDIPEPVNGASGALDFSTRAIAPADLGAEP